MQDGGDGPVETTTVPAAVETTVLATFEVNPEQISYEVQEQLDNSFFDLEDFRTNANYKNVNDVAFQ